MIEFKKNILVKDLCFSYKKNRDVQILRNVNLNIPRLSKIGITGPSGSGKSTLLDLIMGFLEPTSGAIFVDGIQIKSDSNGYVYLWDGTNDQILTQVFDSDQPVVLSKSFGYTIGTVTSNFSTLPVAATLTNDGYKLAVKNEESYFDTNGNRSDNYINWTIYTIPESTTDQYLFGSESNSSLGIDNIYESSINYDSNEYPSNNQIQNLEPLFNQDLDDDGFVGIQVVAREDLNSSKNDIYGDGLSFDTDLINENTETYIISSDDSIDPILITDIYGYAASLNINTSSISRQAWAVEQNSLDENGKMHGKWEWYSRHAKEGQVESRHNFRNGKLLKGSKLFMEDGGQFYENKSGNLI